jgi:hypothetical protein
MQSHPTLDVPSDRIPIRWLSLLHLVYPLSHTPGPAAAIHVGGIASLMYLFF